MKLSIVIPCYNERHTIRSIVEAVRAAPVADKEIIIVDDCSSDGTREILRAEVEGLVHRIIYHPVNCGKGAALRTGFAAATGDAVIVQDADLKPGQPRLLTVDHEVVVPVGKNVIVGLKSNDVIHDWAMPSFGVKLDAVPGRLQLTWFRAEREGIYYGQCSELCGRNHAFMPIAVRVVSEQEFNDWVAKTKSPSASREETNKVAAARD